FGLPLRLRVTRSLGWFAQHHLPYRSARLSYPAGDAGAQCDRHYRVFFHVQAGNSSGDTASNTGKSIVHVTCWINAHSTASLSQLPGLLLLPAGPTRVVLAPQRQ